MPVFGTSVSQTSVRCVIPYVGTGIHEAAVFVQMADGGRSPKALCTTVHFTDDELLVLKLDEDQLDEGLVLVRRGRYELPLLEARAGQHWELTLAAPWGERIMLQFDRAGTQTAPPPEEGDGAVAACSE
jgi:hypothetical protein